MNERMCSHDRTAGVVARSFLIIALIGCVLISGSMPAHARYDGATAVDTWVSIGDRIRDEGKGEVGPFEVGVLPSSVKHVVWVIDNLGGHKHDLKYVTFHGCDERRGFTFRYVAPSGDDVTWRVTHSGYTAHRTLPGEHARLNIWIRSTQKGREDSCVLHASGNGRDDSVELWVHS